VVRVTINVVMQAKAVNFIVVSKMLLDY
jgi:hypothetical protein